MIKKTILLLIGIIVLSACGDRCIEQPNKDVKQDSTQVAQPN